MANDNLNNSDFFVTLFQAIQKDQAFNDLIHMFERYFFLKNQIRNIENAMQDSSTDRAEFEKIKENIIDHLKRNGFNI